MVRTEGRNLFHLLFSVVYIQSMIIKIPPKKNHGHASACQLEGVRNAMSVGAASPLTCIYVFQILVTIFAMVYIWETTMPFWQKASICIHKLNKYTCVGNWGLVKGAVSSRSTGHGIGVLVLVTENNTLRDKVILLLLLHKWVSNFQSQCVHLKLGHRFHALLKVCSDRDDSVPLIAYTVCVYSDGFDAMILRLLVFFPRKYRANIMFLYFDDYNN